MSPDSLGAEIFDPLSTRITALGARSALQDKR